MKLERVDSQLLKELNQIIAYDFKDPRINTIISVTAVETTKDLKYAKVYVSIMDGDTQNAVKILNSAASFFKAKLFERLKIRSVPNLTFYADTSAAYGAKIESILKKISIGTSGGEEK